MGTRDERVDAYIAKSQDFAKPILTYLRETIHDVCPDSTETIKWGVPSFEYKGPFAGMAAFKHHATFGMWKGQLIFGDNSVGGAMGHLGRLTKLSDLPPKKKLVGYLKRGMELNDQGVKVRMRKKTGPAKPLRVPPYLAAALTKNKKAQTSFATLSPSHKREYIDWIAEAKSDETRARRLAQAIEWIAEGKSRNWKYMKR